MLSFSCRAALEVDITEPAGGAPVPPPTAEAPAPPPTQETRVATPPCPHDTPKQTAAGASDPVVQDSTTERSPPITEQTQPPRPTPPPTQQIQQTDAQKKKELLLREQRKLKQTQLPRKSPAPAYVAVPSPAKEKAAAPTQPAASAQPAAPASTGTVALVQQSPSSFRIAPGSTLTPRQGLLLSAHNLESDIGWEALPMQTPSGNTFGSDKKFAMDWASADTGEVSSQRSTPMHPSSGSMVAKTLHELQIATLKASRTATVSPSKTRTMFP